MPRSLVAVALALSLGACASSGTKEPVPVIAVDMIYATDRAASGDPEPADYFGGDRGVLSFGWAQVTVAGNEEQSSEFWPQVLSMTEPPELVSLSPAAEGAQLADLAAADLAKREEKSALVFIHGYKKSFSRAAKNLANIVYGSDYRGLPVLFSWPSSDRLGGYASDSNTLRWSTRNFVDTLNMLADAHDLETIHIVAHSMGSQAVLHALENERPDQERGDWVLGELVLYAPDVDRDRFLRDAMPVLRSAGIRTTLYVSELDIPLMSSKVVNKYPRLGDSGAALTVAEGLETIDASEVAGLFGTHTYHLSRRGQQDLGYLLNQRLGAAERPTLTPTSGEQGDYWLLLPEPKPEKAKESKETQG